MLTGSTALSVETRISCSVPWSRAARVKKLVPIALFSIAAKGFCSIIGTCLKAASVINQFRPKAAEYFRQQDGIGNAAQNILN